MDVAVLELVANELPVAIWMGRVPSGEVVYTNRAFREVLGIEPPPGAVAGAFVEPYGVHQLDGTPYPEENMPYPRALAARATVVVDDLVIHRRDGRHVNLRVFAKPLFDADGNITHVLEAFTDITREVEAERARVEGERKLARAQRLESIGQLVTGISHDFNNLLTVTTLATARLSATERDHERRAALRDIETVTDSAIELVKNLLGFAGRTPQSVAPIEVGAIVASVVDISQRTFERRVTLSVELAPEGAWICGDRSQVEQVLMNLLVNARDAIAGVGHVRVTTSVRMLEAGSVENCPVGRYVVVEVTDDGCGIDPSIRDRVFEPYFTTKTVGAIKGTGLGLSTVLGIVRSHAGFIEPCPAARRGTTMRIALPAIDPPALAQPARAADSPLPRGNNELLLVVDDERLVRSATATTLEALGYRVLEAESGQRALEVFASNADDIAGVILDMVMPGLPVPETFKALRACRPDLPVLLVTGTSMNDEVRVLLERGARGLLPKPFHEAELAEALRAVLGTGATVTA